MCVCVCVCIFLIANEAEHLFMYLFAICLSSLGFPCGSAGKESACNAGDLGSIPGLGKIPWRRERLPTPVFWPGEFLSNFTFTLSSLVKHLFLSFVHSSNQSICLFFMGYLSF